MSQSSSAKMDNGGPIPHKDDDDSESVKSIDCDAIMEKLDTLVNAVSEVTDRLKDNEARVEKLTYRFSKMAATPGSSGKHSTHKFSTASASRFESEDSPSTDTSGNDGLEYTELQSAYVQIRDSLQKVILPNRMSMGDTGPSVKGDARRTLAIIRRAAGYTTTMLKLMKVSSEKDVPVESDWDLLYTCLLTLHKTLQSEQTSAVFEGSGVPPETLQLYKFLSKNSNISRSDTLALENATRLSTAISMAKGQSRQDFQQQRRGNSFGGRYNSFRGRGGSNFRGAGRGRENSTQPDYFDNAVASASAGKP
jgi:hypothetical protein